MGVPLNTDGLQWKIPRNGWFGVPLFWERPKWGNMMGFHPESFLGRWSLLREHTPLAHWLEYVVDILDQLVENPLSQMLYLWCWYIKTYKTGWFWGFLCRFLYSSPILFAYGYFYGAFEWNNPWNELKHHLSMELPMGKNRNDEEGCAKKGWSLANGSAKAKRRSLWEGFQDVSSRSEWSGAIPAAWKNHAVLATCAAQEVPVKLQEVVVVAQPVGTISSWSAGMDRSSQHEMRVFLWKFPARHGEIPKFAGWFPFFWGKNIHRSKWMIKIGLALSHDGSVCMPYMVTFTINIPQMFVYIYHIWIRHGFTYIYLKNDPNVGKYSIHGACGYDLGNQRIFLVRVGQTPSLQCPGHPRAFLGALAVLFLIPTRWCPSSWTRSVGL